VTAQLIERDLLVGVEHSAELNLDGPGSPGGLTDF
jgi:hypothetical protein